MKKIFALCLGLAVASAVKAQNDFPLQFVDKDNNVIVDGTTIIITDYDTDDFGDIIMPSKLYVKNTSKEAIQAGGAYNIHELGSGTFQTCFLSNCVRQTATGIYTTSNGIVAPGELKDMQTEWYPKAEGSCRVTYQLVTYYQNPSNMKWVRDGDGPAVTLVFNYGPTAVKRTATDSQVQNVEYFNMAGQQVEQREGKMFIIRKTYNDGSQTVRKQLKR